VRVLERRGDLEQVGAHGGGPVVKQRVTAAPDWVRVDRVGGSAAQPLGQDPAVACAEEVRLLALGAA
jgi:hypothetical protein